MKFFKPKEARKNYPSWTWWYPTAHLMKTRRGIFEQFWVKVVMPENLPREEWVKGIAEGRLWHEYDIRDSMIEFCTEDRGEWRPIPYEDFRYEDLT